VHAGHGARRAGRRLVVLAGPGDRRDEDLREVARVAAGRFDHYICRRDDGLRGRAPDEVPRIIAAALREHGVPEDRITIIPDEQEAVDAGLRMAGPGDLLLIFVDQITRSWKQVIGFEPGGHLAASRPPGAGGGPATLGPTPRPQGRRPRSRSLPRDPRPSPGRASLETLVRDERGVRLARESDD
jgi:cyanophycin synthetase